eukprot:3134511-Amphidinium_carterae.1
MNDLIYRNEVLVSQMGLKVMSLYKTFWGRRAFATVQGHASLTLSLSKAAQEMTYRFCPVVRSRTNT